MDLVNTRVAVGWACLPRISPAAEPFLQSEGQQEIRLTGMVQICKPTGYGIKEECAAGSDSSKIIYSVLQYLIMISFKWTATVTEC
jgi:hypothetical protein